MGTTAVSTYHVSANESVLKYVTRLEQKSRHSQWAHDAIIMSLWRQNMVQCKSQAFHRSSPREAITRLHLSQDPFKMAASCALWAHGGNLHHNHKKTYPGIHGKSFANTKRQATAYQECSHRGLTPKRGICLLNGHPRPSAIFHVTASFLHATARTNVWSTEWMMGRHIDWQWSRPIACFSKIWFIITNRGYDCDLTHLGLALVPLSAHGTVREINSSPPGQNDRQFGRRHFQMHFLEWKW